MSAVQLTPLTLPGFEALPSLASDELELVLRGNADMRAKGAFGQYLKDLDLQVRSSGARCVKVHMAELYFLSSSCFQAIAAWVLLVASRPAESRYTVYFQTHPGQAWQKRSLEAIRRVAVGVAEVL